MRFRTKFAAALITFVAALTLGVATTPTPANAISGACFYWADSGHHAALNAWSGGPFVKVYHDCADPNDRFTIVFVGGNNIQLKFTGGGPWNGKCIGDAYNDPNNASTSLDACNPAGWGTIFQENFNTNNGCPGGTLAFWNNHWSGYLGPPNGYVDGSPFYVNNFGYVCFSIA